MHVTRFFIQNSVGEQLDEKKGKRTVRKLLPIITVTVVMS